MRLIKRKTLFCFSARRTLPTPKVWVSPSHYVGSADHTGLMAHSQKTAPYFRHQLEVVGPKVTPLPMWLYVSGAQDTLLRFASLL